jgi:hypothetical protein
MLVSLDRDIGIAMRKIALLLTLSSLISLLFIAGVSAFQEEASVDVTFEVITGSGRSDYYVGDYFWYNISLVNSGSTFINATFKVTVLNTTGGILIDGSKDYFLTLKPNETTSLYPNYTRLGREEHSVYYFETSGTYSIVLSSETPLKYYKFYSSGAYTFSTNACQFSFDVMPSYQRVQNDRWNDFLNKNEEYMKQVDIQTQKAMTLTYYTIILAVFSIFVAMGSIFVSWWQLSKEEQKQNRLVFRGFLIFCVVFLLLIAYEFWVIISQT